METADGIYSRWPMIPNQYMGLYWGYVSFFTRTVKKPLCDNLAPKFFWQAHRKPAGFRTPLVGYKMLFQVNYTKFLFYTPCVGLVVRVVLRHRLTI
jgi:hypothetical protein